MQDLRTILSDEYLEKRAENFWYISEVGCENMLKIRNSLPNNYLRYSEKALKKILKIMRETLENDRKIIEDLYKK